MIPSGQPEPATPGAPPVIGLRRRSPGFEVLRGQAKRWLAAHQAGLAKRTEGCPSVYVDIPNRKVTFGTPLADRFEAWIIAVAGVWVPHTRQFSLTLLDDSCPPALTERLQWCVGKPPLAGLPELSLPLWENTEEEDAWAMAALLGEGCAAAGVQAAGSPGGLAFLLIEEITPVPASRRAMSPAAVLKRREFLVQPAVDALAMVLARNPLADAPAGDTEAQQALEHESVDELRQALALCEGLVARMNECAAELQSRSEPELAGLSGAFSGPASDLERTLESVAAAFEQANAATVASSLSELCVILGGLVPERQQE